MATILDTAEQKLSIITENAVGQLCSRSFNFRNTSKFTHSTVDGHFSYFRFLAIVNSAAENVFLVVSWCECANIYIGHPGRSGIVGP